MLAGWPQFPPPPFPPGVFVRAADQCTMNKLQAAQVSAHEHAQRALSSKLMDRKLEAALTSMSADNAMAQWQTTLPKAPFDASHGQAFPWLVAESVPVPSTQALPEDISRDAARVATVLDLRQLLGAHNKNQEELTEILCDHDMSGPPESVDYLIPNAESNLWTRISVEPPLRERILARLRRFATEGALSNISWCGTSHIVVGHHKLPVRDLDVQRLRSRWCGAGGVEVRELEIARILALYGALDNPLSHRRNGMHLALDPKVRSRCDFELFASPMNAVLPNGKYASKWPHIEWRFGSAGSYPSVLPSVRRGSIVCCNPPFAEVYLQHFAEKLPQLKAAYRLRVAMPIWDAPWRDSLTKLLPSARILHSYYDASEDQDIDLLQPTLFWEDSRCDRDFYRAQVRGQLRGQPTVLQEEREQPTVVQEEPRCNREDYREQVRCQLREQVRQQVCAQLLARWSTQSAVVPGMASTAADRSLAGLATTSKIAEVATGSANANNVTPTDDSGATSARSTAATSSDGSTNSC